MKHGDQAKKSAKAVQASGKKSSSKEAVAKTSKESGSGKAKTSSKEAGPKAGAKKAGGKNVESVKGASVKSAAGVEAPAKTATKTAPAKTAVKAPGKDAVKAGIGGNGKTKVVDSGGPSFANAIVAAAFKRAVKKYSAAFRRLTD